MLCSPTHLFCHKELFEDEFQNKLREVDTMKVVVVVAVAAAEAVTVEQ